MKEKIDNKLKKQLDKILCRMQRLCIGRERCTSDIRNKILTAINKKFQGMSEEWREEQCSAMLNSLIKDKFIDDMRYATAYCKDKATLAGWGPTKIKAYLSRKGISNEMANEALEEIDEKSSEKRMERVLEVKFNSLYKSEIRKASRFDEELEAKIKEDGELPWEIKQRMLQKFLRYTISRGYSYDKATPLFKIFLTKNLENSN